MPDIVWRHVITATGASACALYPLSLVLGLSLLTTLTLLFVVLWEWTAPRRYGEV